MARSSYLFGFLAVLFVGCSNSTSVPSSGPDAAIHDSILPIVDTLVKMDTVIHVDTLIKVDTAIRYDTITYYHTDTLYIQSSNPYTSPDMPKSYIDTVNIVFFGNSLLLGYSTFGMSASDPSQDYYSKVNASLRSNGIYTNSVRVPTGNYESLLDSTSQEDLLSERLYPKISKETDYVFLQLGDNVNTVPLLENLEGTIDRIINGVKARGSTKTKIYAVATWYINDYANRARSIIENQANLNGIGFIDISQYNTEENRAYIGQVVYRPTLNRYRVTYDSYTEIACTVTITFTVSDVTATVSITPDSWEVDEENKVLTWTGHEYVVTSIGIAYHPGDRGFTAIADAIVGAVMSDYE